MRYLEIQIPDNIEEMASNVATNAAVKARGSTLRVDVAKGTVGPAEQVEAGRYKKPDEELKKQKEWKLFLMKDLQCQPLQL